MYRLNVGWACDKVRVDDFSPSNSIANALPLLVFLLAIATDWVKKPRVSLVSLTHSCQVFCLLIFTRRLNPLSSKPKVDNRSKLNHFYLASWLQAAWPIRRHLFILPARQLRARNCNVCMHTLLYWRNFRRSTGSYLLSSTDHLLLLSAFQVSLLLSASRSIENSLRTLNLKSVHWGELLKAEVHAYEKLVGSARPRQCKVEKSE